MRFQVSQRNNVYFFKSTVLNQVHKNSSMRMVWPQKNIAESSLRYLNKVIKRISDGHFYYIIILWNKYMSFCEYGNLANWIMTWYPLEILSTIYIYIYIYIWHNFFKILLLFIKITFRNAYFFLIIAIIKIGICDY